MSKINWDEYLSNLEKAGGQQIGPGPGAEKAAQEAERRQQRLQSDIGAALSVFPDIRPQGDQTGLPAAFGIAGGLLPFVAPQTRVGRSLTALGAGTRAAPYLPSLAGSTIGTVFGTAAEEAVLPRPFVASNFAKQLAGNVVENAAWDVGGNLVFNIGGKAFKVAKNTFGNAAGQVDPRVAVQEWLSARGGTLTRSQLTGSATTRTLEEAAKGGFGGEAFRTQQAGVEKAITQGLQEVKDTLNTSDAFKLALASDEPFTRAAGENFKELIATGREAFKDRYRPFYQSLTEQNGVYVDLRGIKTQAQKELANLSKIKDPKGATKDRIDVLDSVVAQNDFVDFGTAHQLRSDFFASADDLAQPGKATTSKQQIYTKYASEFEKAMDDAIQFAASTPQQKEKLIKRNFTFVPFEQGQRSTIVTGEQFNPFLTKTTLSKDIVNEYNRVKGLYKEGFGSLYNETITSALQQAPSKVGSYLADLSESEKFTDLFRAVGAIDEYVKKAGVEGEQLINDVKYSFLEKNLATPDMVTRFSTALKQDKDMNSAFFKMFRNEAPQLKQIIAAADTGLQEGSQASYLRNRAIGSVGITGAGLAGVFLLPDEVQEKLSNAIPQLAATAGVFIVTPRLIARATTNKDAMDALAGLAKASNQPRYGGAATAKIIDSLNKSGIIDSEYLTSVNNIFNAPPATTTETQQMPSGQINWDEAVTSD
jgi:hypothetical protein